MWLRSLMKEEITLFLYEKNVTLTCRDRTFEKARFHHLSLKANIALYKERYNLVGCIT